MSILTRRTVELAGVKVRLQPGISPFVAEWIITGWYERDELEALQGALDQDDIVLELGTGLGLLSTYCALRTGSDRVFTYEANPRLKPLIVETYELNGVSPTLELAILGARHGSKTFFISKDFWGSSDVPDDSAIETISVPVKPISVEMGRLRPTMMIIDIEGGEFELFQHLSLEGVQKILIETHEFRLGAEKTQFVLDNIRSQGLKEDTEFSSGSVFLFRR